MVADAIQSAVQKSGLNEGVFTPVHGAAKEVSPALVPLRYTKTVGFTGATGGKMKELSDYLVNVPATDTPRIQESHIMLGHIICQLVEELYFKIV